MNKTELIEHISKHADISKAAATRALDCATFATYSDGAHRVSFDEVVKVMLQTGSDLPRLYRETAGGGLAITYRFPPKK